MFNVVSRIYQPTSGSVRVRRRRPARRVPAHGIAKLGIARTFQNLALFPSMTLLENVMVGAHSQGSVGFARAIAAHRPWPARSARPATFADDLLARSSTSARSRSARRPACPSAR